MEKSYIGNMNLKYLNEIGFNINQINMVAKLVNRGIEEKLYIKTNIPYHNIKHIERVLCYCVWILNKKMNKGEYIDNQDILFYSALYHDCGRSLRISNKMHGVVGSKIARDKLENTFDDKMINAIELLIETHVKKDNHVDFKDYDFTEHEKANIQILSNILKDADALDRNRIKICPFCQCRPSYLRTDEAKEIYKSSDLFLQEYEKAKNN